MPQTSLVCRRASAAVPSKFYGGGRSGGADAFFLCQRVLSGSLLHESCKAVVGPQWALLTHAKDEAVNGVLATFWATRHGWSPEFGCVLSTYSIIIPEVDLCTLRCLVHVVRAVCSVPVGDVRAVHTVRGVRERRSRCVRTVEFAAFAPRCSWCSRGVPFVVFALFAGCYGVHVLSAVVGAGVRQEVQHASLGAGPNFGGLVHPLCLLRFNAAKQSDSLWS